MSTAIEPIMSSISTIDSSQLLAFIVGSIVVAGLGLMWKVVGTKVSIFFEGRILKKKERKISWDELRSKSKDLLNRIKSGQVNESHLHKLIIKPEEQKIYEKAKEGFKPDVIFAPCSRGATIANAMFDKQEERLPIYVGMRINKDDTASNIGKISEKHEKCKQMNCNNKKCDKTDWFVAHTAKHYHFIPYQLIELLRTYKNINVLLLDDYANSGNSQRAIYQTIKTAAHISDDRIRAASFAVDNSAI
ncbi:MAG: hypothetical protein LBC03_02995, partial [Nitrososphaerota archaeon]|nr:hypothetical protein [Nitrososphaerota archaeon]